MVGMGIPVFLMMVFVLSWEIRMMEIYMAVEVMALAGSMDVGELATVLDTAQRIATSI
jgi:hypothetical protein